MYKPHFSHKTEAKNRGCGLSMDTSMLEFSKTYLIFIKLLKVPRKKHKRNSERVAVVKGVFECLSANLALQKFLQAIKFALLEQINVCSQSLPSVSFRYVRYSTTKCASIQDVNGQLFRCFLLASWQIRRLSYQAPVLREVFQTYLYRLYP